MLFNSVDFAIFLPLVFALYWLIPRREIQAQNLLLLAASYVFYGWWDWRFLSLIILSSAVDYFVGLELGRRKRPSIRRSLLSLSLAVNIGLLGFFKYFAFFVDSFADAFTLFGGHIEGCTLHIVLPVGISFYTFQTLSYTIDVYRGKTEPTRNVIAFFAFVAFFPQLVAGPIERAKNLLPQFFEARSFDYDHAVDGMRQILWGLFKKIVIADSCAPHVNAIFGNSAEMSGSTLLCGAVLFAFQIYGDFSGYSDIAIGTARLFGFSLMRNFAYPYFSRDIAEFWRRWHISLSSWFKDYVYIPLGGSRGGTAPAIRNTFVIFLVSGFWHGANWTFIAWGLLNALFFLPLMLLSRNRANLDVVARGRFLPTLREGLQVLSTFLLTVLAWIFFRAESLSHAFAYLGGLFDASLFSMPRYLPPTLGLLIILMLSTEWLQRDKQYGLEDLQSRLPFPLRWGLYYALTFLIFMNTSQQREFIYFQF